jgi:heptosyltransferase-2
MTIAVFKLNHLGDNVVFVPAFQELRRRCPGFKIALLTTPREAELYGGISKPNEIIVSQKSAFDKSYRRPWVLAHWFLTVRRLRPHACLVPFDQGNVVHTLAWLSGARIRVGAKLEPARMAGSLTEEVPMPADASPATWNWATARALARSLGCDSGWPDEPPAPDLRHLLPRGPKPAGERRRIVIHAGASRHLNKWPTDNFASVATSLSHDFDVVWVSHGGTTGSAPPGTTDAPVNSIGELAEWLASSDLFLGNNSGPMHLANALGCSGVVVTGPSAAGWNPYWYRDRWTVLRHPDLYCAPCERLTKELAGCANIESDMACLKYWTVEKVTRACRAQIDNMR